MHNDVFCNTVLVKKLCCQASFLKFYCSLYIEQCDIVNSEVDTMSKRFRSGFQESLLSHNIYADKSSLVLDWLLHVGIDRYEFSIREVARDTGISLGLVQRVFRVLVFNGYLQSEGYSTAKKFVFKNPAMLLQSWLENYSIVKKCRMRTYASGFQGREHILNTLRASYLASSVVLALHTAAEWHACKNTNLQTIELYLLKPSIRTEIEQELLLEPKERGYEVLLIEPYYKSLLNPIVGVEKEIDMLPHEHKNTLTSSSPLLTFLDLYHFPLRGREQAEFMAQKMPEIKRIYKKAHD